MAGVGVQRRAFSQVSDATKDITYALSHDAKENTVCSNMVQSASYRRPLFI